MSNRSTAIAIGGIVGAILGATAAWAYSQAQEGKLTGGGAGQLQLKAGAPDYVKVGVALLALVRQVTDLFRPS